MQFNINPKVIYTVLLLFCILTSALFIWKSYGAVRYDYHQSEPVFHQIQSPLFTHHHRHHRTKIIPFFKKLHTFQCSELLTDNLTSHLYNSIRLLKPISFSEYSLYSMLTDCEQLYSNFYFASQPNTDYESSYPLAFSIRMFKSTLQVIKLLESIYAPQNSYCIHVDWKSPKIIHDNINLLSQCLPNLMVTKPQSVFWGGHSMLNSTLSCVNDLYRSPTINWNYVIILEENDFPVTTNYEMVYVLKELYQTVNDVPLTSWSNGRMHRHPILYDDQGLPYRLQFKGNQIKSTRKPPSNITLYKGLHQSSLHRRFVHFMLHDNRSIQLLNYVAKNMDFTDEVYISTLVHDNANLNAPGSFPGHCVNLKSFKKTYITRYSLWWSKNNQACPKSTARHTICLWGIRNVTKAVQLKGPFFINKFHPEYQPIAMECMREIQFNQTYLYPKSNVNWYLHLNDNLNEQHSNDSAVRYREWRELNPTTDSKQYNCV